MKKIITFIQLTVLTGLFLVSPAHAADENKVLTHVIVVWLNDAGDEKARNTFVKASKKLNNLPGIIYRNVSVVEKSDRSIVDDTFDVLITVTFKNKAALQAYLDHPKHKAAVKVFKTMANRIVIYNSIGS
ncbi:MAG: Dabb family protein [Methylococcales bacterium]|nr:Dabb family protein [Methylococcales bacterium]